MKKLLLLITMTSACLFMASTASAQIQVTGSGAGPLTFNTTPTAAEFSTGVLNGDGTTYETTAALEAGAQTVDVAAVVRTLPTSTTLPPSTYSGGFRHNNNNPSGFFIQSRPTTDATNAANVMVAHLMNASGSTISSMTVEYTFGISNAPTGLLPGFRVYWSLSGAPSSWNLISSLSDTEVAGTQNGTITPSWPNNTAMYLLWVDDNANGVTDPAYTIDDFVISLSGSIPLSVSLTAPANNALMFIPTNVTLSANTGGTTPATSVSFFTNGVLAGSDSSSPFSIVLNALPPGTYAIYAEAVNGVDPTARSSTNTILVRDEFVSYTGGTISENFDSMTSAGTKTPTGWYVGAALPATTVDVTVGDGSAGASTAILGWNYGTTSASDRALGTAPTGADRNMEVRIKNNTASAISSITFHFDGEVWRNYTNANDGWLTNFVSVDLGTNWVATGFNFDQPTARAQPQGAVDGNAAGNRTAGIGGTFTLPSAVPVGGVIYIRWQDFNGVGVTDGGLAIDNFTFSGGTPGPTLTVRYLSSTQVELSWPISADVAGALLYFKPDLNAASWSLETGGIDSISGGTHFKTITSTSPAMKFWTLRTNP